MLRVVVMVLAILSVACGGTPVSPPETGSDSGQGRMISAELTIQTSGASTQVPGADECVGAPPYEDLRKGMPVRVRNESGTVVATDELGRGLPEPDGSCRFYVTVSGLPDADAYTIQFGDREGISKSRDDFGGNVWDLDIEVETQLPPRASRATSMAPPVV